MRCSAVEAQSDIENFRGCGLNSVVLVATLEKGVNDGEIGYIIRYAVENLDVVKGINFQDLYNADLERLHRRGIHFSI